MNDKTENGSSRRDFLKLASVSTTAAVAAVVLSDKRADAAEEEIIYGDTRLRSTPHTRAYFNSLRF